MSQNISEQLKNPIKYKKSTNGKSPLNTVAVTLFVITTLVTVFIVPWYGFTVGYSWHSVLMAFVFFYITGISITAGYHRLWSHSTYKAHWLVKSALALLGGMALQNSILVWSAGHRIHHRYVDNNKKDPYSAKRGLWWSHMGWMLRHYPETEPDFSVIPDLQRDKIAMFQHKHYNAIALGGNIFFPIALGLLFGDLWGYVLLVGFTRIFAVHHVTFFINSLAHYWGRQPYTDENTAKDNGILSLFTFGEGYHNYHHIFQNDYRNGICWHHYDPTKWLIKSLSYIGLTYDLRKVSQFKINRRMLEMQFKRAQEKTKARQFNAPALAILEHEYEYFKSVIAEWTTLQTQKFEDKKEQLKGKWLEQKTQLEKRIHNQQQRVRVIFKQYQFS